MSEANPQAAEAEAQKKLAGLQPKPADLKEFGFTMATNDKGEMIWVRPLCVLDVKQVKDSGMTEFDVLEILEAKSLSVLNRVVMERQKLGERLKEDLAKLAGQSLNQQ